MSDPFQLRFETRDDIRRIYILASGEIDSPRYLAETIEYFKSNPASFAYDRIVDFIDVTGLVEYADLVRSGDYWKSVQHLMPRTVRIGLITVSPLAIARLPMAALYYPKHDYQAFPTRAEVEAWLDSATD